MRFAVKKMSAYVIKNNIFYRNYIKKEPITTKVIIGFEYLIKDLFLHMLYEEARVPYENRVSRGIHRKASLR